MDFLSRLLRHLFATSRQTHRHFPKDALKHIEESIAASEIGHSGQIRFIVETSLSPYALFHYQTAKQRALELFSAFRIWDTEQNNGVLIYLLMADHDFEILADRGVYMAAGDAFWDDVIKMMEKDLQAGNFEQGVLLGISKIDEVLRKLYPADHITPNELSDKPVII